MHEFTRNENKATIEMWLQQEQAANLLDDGDDEDARVEPDELEEFEALDIDALEEAADSEAAQTGAGAELVGKRIKVREGRKWYEGDVEEFAVATRRHRVKYLGGDPCDEQLGKEDWELVGDTPPPPPPPTEEELEAERAAMGRAKLQAAVRIAGAIDAHKDVRVAFAASATPKCELVQNARGVWCVRTKVDKMTPDVADNVAVDVAYQLQASESAAGDAAEWMLKGGASKKPTWSEPLAALGRARRLRVRVRMVYKSVAEIDDDVNVSGWTPETATDSVSVWSLSLPFDVPAMKADLADRTRRDAQLLKARTDIEALPRKTLVEKFGVLPKSTIEQTDDHYKALRAHLQEDMVGLDGIAVTGTEGRARGQTGDNHTTAF